jgi:hypothetical protein
VTEQSNAFNSLIQRVRNGRPGQWLGYVLIGSGLALWLYRLVVMPSRTACPTVGWREFAPLL